MNKSRCVRNRFFDYEAEDGAVGIYKVGEDSSLQKLIRMVEDAEKNQAPTQRIADKWASRLVPAALLIAVINEKAAREIKAALIKMGIAEEKIRWQGNTYQKDDFYNNHYFPLLRETYQAK